MFLSATFSCLFSSTFSLVLFFYKFFEHIFMFLLIVIIIQAKSNILLTFISYLCAFFLSWHSNFIRNFNSTKYLFAFFSDRFIAITTNTQMSLLIPTKFRQKQKQNIWKDRSVYGIYKLYRCIHLTNSWFHNGIMYFIIYKCFRSNRAPFP